MPTCTQLLENGNQAPEPNLQKSNLAGAVFTDTPRHASFNSLQAHGLDLCCKAISNSFRFSSIKDTLNMFNIQDITLRIQLIFSNFPVASLNIFSDDFQQFPTFLKKKKYSHSQNTSWYSTCTSNPKLSSSDALTAGPVVHYFKSPFRDNTTVAQTKPVATNHSTH